MTAVFPLGKLWLLLQHQGDKEAMPIKHLEEYRDPEISRFIIDNINKISRKKGRNPNRLSFKRI
jgi:hypothetical protein